MIEKRFEQIESALDINQPELLRLGFALLFLVMCTIYVGVVFKEVPNNFLLVAASVIGGYMAMNIGANDVANNVGPAVGSRTLTLTGAIVIAAVFESAGAIIAGGDVVSTIKKGIIDPALFGDPNQFVWLMTGALLAGAAWLNIATWLGLPVSTTHSIVDGVLGAGIAAGGYEVANWARVGAIAASWVISPVMGGIIAALFLYFIKRTITYQTDMVAAAKRILPYLIAIMAWAFGAYLTLKGLGKIWKTDFLTAALIGLGAAVAGYFVMRFWLQKAIVGVSADKTGINKLFVAPLICAAALLSFAHGANDVANAVGPLAAVHDTLLSGEIAQKAHIPFWVMLIGALGISLGLALYGLKLIRTLGSEITELDQSRAFCIAMAAALTVIVATQLGLPVSSTHTAIGGVFGVGLLREMLKSNYAKVIDEIRDHHEDAQDGELETFLRKFENAPFEQKGEMIAALKQRAERPVDDKNVAITKVERKRLGKVYRIELVKRSLGLRIVGAWVITVPLTALLGAMFYFTLRGMLLQ